jgi:hypothetical protein
VLQTILIQKDSFIDIFANVQFVRERVHLAKNAILNNNFPQETAIRLTAAKTDTLQRNPDFEES